MAVCSGLRENELRQLEPKHLDRERCGIRVEREIDKARKERLQPIPAALMERLEAFVASGEAKKLYAAAYSQQGQREGKKKQPRNPLLYVPANSATMLKRDLEAAGIPAVTDKGKLDFHALRTAYINFVIDTGTDVKTAQELARHASPHMTMNVYGRARDEKCREVVEAVGKRVYCDKSGQETSQDCHENYIKLTQVPEKLSPEKTTTAFTASGCSDDTLVRKRGLEPKFRLFRRIA